MTPLAAFLLLACSAEASNALRAALPKLGSGPAAPIAARLSTIPWGSPERLARLVGPLVLPSDAAPEAVERALLDRRAALDDQANELVRLATTGPAKAAPERVGRAYDLLIDGYPFLSDENTQSLLAALPALKAKRALYERAAETRLWAEAVARRLADAPASEPLPAENEASAMKNTPEQERIGFLNTIWDRIRQISFVIVPKLPYDASLPAKLRLERVEFYARFAARLSRSLRDPRELDPQTLRELASEAGTVIRWHNEYVDGSDHDWDSKALLKERAEWLPSLLRDLARKIEAGEA